MPSVQMPALGESVTEGTVTRWLKNVGDTVEVDEPLLEVSTDKVDTEIPSPVAGTLVEILVQEDETVEVGARLALVGSGAGASGGSSDSGSSDSGSSSSSGGEDRAAGSLADEVSERSKAEGESLDSAERDQAETSQSSASSSGDGVPERQVADEAPASASGAEQASEDYNSPAKQTGGPVTPPVDPGRTAPAAPADVSAYVTPLVRKLAASEGVDLASVKGTGVGGRIRKEDVQKAAEAAKAKAAESAKPAAAAPSGASGGSAAKAAPAPAQVSAKRGTTEKMSRLRKVIAARMVESLQVSAQLTTAVEVDVTRIAKLRERAKDAFKAREGASLSYLPFITLASIEALKQFPQVNASIEGDSIVYHPQENVGIAVDTERGLLVPVIKDAGDLNLAGIARKIGDLAKRTRDNKVTPDELGGGTFTITNTGSRGALFDTPIINQPQVAILGTGAVVKRPAVITGPDGDDVIAVRSMMYLALSYDHRLVDGADAARFLTTLKARLEDGAFEAELGL